MSDGIIGGVGLTHLRVYDQRPGPDGINAGCAHIHALTDEAYFGISGEGALELHDVAHGYRRVPITKGTFVQFSAGTLHRSVSTDALEVVVLMGNAGLAERGDARIYFGPDVDAEPHEFERLKGLVSSGLEGALERRDRSATAYQKLLELWKDDKAAYRAELERFLQQHRSAIAGTAQIFQDTVADGPVRAGEIALARVADLSQSKTTPGADVSTVNVENDEPILGMCGVLRQVKQLTTLA